MTNEAMTSIPIKNAYAQNRRWWIAFSSEENQSTSTLDTYEEVETRYFYFVHQTMTFSTNWEVMTSSFIFY